MHGLSFTNKVAGGAKINLSESSSLGMAALIWHGMCICPDIHERG